MRKFLALLVFTGCTIFVHAQKIYEPNWESLNTRKIPGMVSPR
jgi:hypothetical protein